MAKRILRRKAVEQLTGLSRSSIYALASAGTFPKSVRLSARSVGWVEDDVIAWLDARIAESQAA